MVFGGWYDGEGPRSAVQVYNPSINAWTFWTDKRSQLCELVRSNLITNSQLDQALSTSVSQTVDQGSSQSSVQTKNESDIYINPDILKAHNSHLIGNIPQRVYAGCVLVETKIFIVGGFDGVNALKSTICYNFAIDSGWYEFSCMYEKRYYVCAAATTNCIYAIGGHNGENQGRLDSAERFILKENLWDPIASMNRIRSDASAATLDGCVYVVGGFDGRRYHDTAEYYNETTNQWTLVSRMHSARGGVSVVSLNGYLYAIGGNDGTSRLRTIERYSPKDNKWDIVSHMHRRKSNLSSTVVNDDIYIIGGWSDEPEPSILDLTEKFNVFTGECKLVQALSFPVSATCACTLKNKQLVRKYVKLSFQTAESNVDYPPFGTFATEGELLNLNNSNAFGSHKATHSLVNYERENGRDKSSYLPSRWKNSKVVIWKHCNNSKIKNKLSMTNLKFHYQLRSKSNRSPISDQFLNADSNVTNHKRGQLVRLRKRNCRRRRFTTDNTF